MRAVPSEGDIQRELDRRKPGQSDISTPRKEEDRIQILSGIFEGKTTINDFCKIVEEDDDIFDEVKGDSDSLAGLMLELEGKIPDKGSKTTFRNYIFAAEDVDLKRIKRIKVTITEKLEEQ